MVCRCTLGPTEPDQVWCSAWQVFRIDRGDADGIDLSGVTVAVALELPGDFFGGIDKARLSFDEKASSEQRAAVEAIVTGTRGGVWGALAGAIKEWLPSRTTTISIESGDRVSITIGDYGRVALEPVLAPNGKPARLVDAPVMAAFEFSDVEIANGTGTRGNDPDMRAWESLGHATMTAFSWAA